MYKLANTFHSLGYIYIYTSASFALSLPILDKKVNDPLPRPYPDLPSIATLDFLRKGVRDLDWQLELSFPELR